LSREPVVKLVNLTKRYRNKAVVDNLSFDMYRGEIVGLLGPNGAGKTTTMRMMVGLISITQGDVLINGHSITSDFVQAIAKIGGVIENPEFYPFFTGYENLQQFANMYPDVTEARIDEVVELLGLKSAIHKKVDAYSLGMRQRLGIAQALLHKPTVLILDEPTNGLDPAGIREMRIYFKTIAEKEGITVLVSSHLLSEIELMCDRVIIIKNGQFVDSQLIRGTSDDLRSNVVAFELHDIDEAAKAQQLFTQRFPECADQVVVRDGTLLAPVEKENVPDIISLFVAEHIRIYAVKEERKNLEETFLEKVGGNEIV